MPKTTMVQERLEEIIHDLMAEGWEIIRFEKLPGQDMYIIMMSKPQEMVKPA